MPRILVVDDQRVPRLAVSSILEDAGHEVSAAADGAEGLKLARDLLPDVVVLDVYMPGMDGFEVVERLKRDPETAPTPVIFLTAEPPTDDLIVRGLELGAYDFLSKGCSRAELLARVGVMARIKRSNDELSAVARISDTLIQSLDPDKLSRRFVEQVQDVFRAKAVVLSSQVDPKDPPVHTCIGLDTDDPLLEALSRSLLEAIEHTGEAQADISASELRGHAGVLARRNDFERVLATRVDKDQHTRTLLAVFTRREEGFSRQSDAPLLHLLARQATIALDNARLHERTRAQAVKMEDQAEKLEKAMTERSRFFASMSHELRTPINAVIGYNQLLEIGAYGEMSEDQEQALSRVSRSAQHLLDLINDILDISKIEAGKMEVTIEETDLAKLIEDTVATIQFQAEEKNLALEVEVEQGAIAETDPARVRQILLNLLSNAVKFTEEGKVAVRLRRRGDHFEIEVRDTGAGIAAEDFDRVFEEFEQTQQTPSTGGTGLGLPISKRLAQLLGGELDLKSELGVGSTFILRLPARQPEKSAA